MSYFEGLLRTSACLTLCWLGVACGRIGYDAAFRADSGGADAARASDAARPTGVDAPADSFTPPIDGLAFVDAPSAMDVLTLPVDVASAPDVRTPDVAPSLDVAQPLDTARSPDVAQPLDVAQPPDVAQPLDVAQPPDVAQPLDMAPPDVAPPPVAVSFEVGSFVKSAGAVQVVRHGLGRVPRAILMWTGNRTDGALSASSLFALGVSDGPGGTSRSGAVADEDAVTPTAAFRRMSTQLISLVGSSGTTRLEAGLSAWDAASFTLAWTTNDATPTVVHYLLLGGAAVMSKVIGWTSPVAPGRSAVTGVGFKPDVVLNFYLGAGFTRDPPSIEVSQGFGIGVMDGSGSQWSNFQISSNGAPVTSAYHGQRADAAIFMCSETEITKVAQWASMDPDGFTVDFTVANGNPGRIFSLALKGVAARIGRFEKPTEATPAPQRLSNLGLRPGLLMLSSVQDSQQNVAVPNGPFGFGASDGKTQASTAFVEVSGFSPSAVFGADRSDRLFLKIDGSSRRIDAEATLTSFDTGGFTLGWPSNDLVPATISYLVLGAP